MQNVVEADPCCHGNEIWAKRGDPVAYRLVLLYQLMAHDIIHYHTIDVYQP